MRKWSGYREAANRQISVARRGWLEEKPTETSMVRRCEQGRTRCKSVRSASCEERKASVAGGTNGAVLRGEERPTASEECGNSREEDATEDHTGNKGAKARGVGVECRQRQHTAAWRDKIGERAALRVKEMVRATTGCSDTSSAEGGTGAVKGGKGDDRVQVNGRKWMAGRSEPPKIKYKGRRRRVKWGTSVEVGQAKES